MPHDTSTQQRVLLALLLSLLPFLLYLSLFLLTTAIVHANSPPSAFNIYTVTPDAGLDDRTVATVYVVLRKVEGGDTQGTRSSARLERQGARQSEATVSFDTSPATFEVTTM